MPHAGPPTARATGDTAYISAAGRGAGALRASRGRFAFLSRNTRPDCAGERCRGMIDLLYTSGATVDGVSSHGLGGKGRPGHPAALLDRLVGHDVRGRTAFSPLVRCLQT